MSSRAAYTLRRFRELTFRQILAKLTRRSEDSRRSRAQRAADAREATYASDSVTEPLARGLAAPKRVPGTEWLEPVCDDYLAHSFDILGSGRVTVEHGMQCAGLEGLSFDPGRSVVADPQGAWLRDRVSAPNLREARRLWSLIGGDYTPIDWQLDIRSGYRWSETEWCQLIAMKPERGADIKMPWELARCHHMPQMALLACWSPAQDRDILAAEFRSQVLDFVATNPPRFGVNWACSMDIGIRVANWVIAWDLFGAAGAEFDEEFSAALARSVLEHGRHIRDNLEGDDTFRGNHYLADIVGLLFAAAYLSATDQTREWWTFSRDELMREIETQFTPDGGNYEASTGYHRLSAEIALYGVALITGVEGADAVPPAIAERLSRAVEFVRDTATPDGTHPRIGDDDSGRLFKLGARYQWTTREQAITRFANLEGLAAGEDLAEDGPQGRYWVEDHLDHRHIIAAAVGLLDRDDLTAKAGEWIDRQLIASLAGGAARLSSPGEPDAAASARVGDDADFERVRTEATARRDELTIRQSFRMSEGRTFDLAGYPDFGLYIFRDHDAYLAIRCGSVGQNGLGGHAHNDQLAVVLSVEGESPAIDPGSYLYTPLPERRDEYRSASAHNVPHLAGREPASLDIDLFRLDDVHATCVYFGKRGFAGYHDGYTSRVWRLVQIAEDSILVTDWSGDPTATLVPPAGGPAPSPGYGIRLRDVDEAAAIHAAGGGAT